jgi:CheY-like chemotaxis protein
MDKVLIVDGNAELLGTLKEGLDKMHQFETLTAADGEQAIQVLSSQPISVFVTDINTPRMDGLELLAYISQNHASTPCIVMTAYGKPWFRKRMDQQEVLYHLEKPFEIGALASAIFVGLNLRDEGIHYKGIKTTSILPLIEIEQKTCRMEVNSNARGKGYLYFDEGVLIDAHFKGFNGEKAAREMANWDRIAFKFSDLPRRRTRTRVKTELMEMAGASWMRDETVDLRNEEISAIRDSALSDDSDLAADREVAETVLQRQLQELRAIKGYLGVGVLNQDGDVLFADLQDDSLDLDRLAIGLSSIFSVTEDTAEQMGFSDCRGLTFHTREGTVLLATSHLAAVEHFRVIGITSPDGNWFYMKVQLENLFPKLAAALG